MKTLLHIAVLGFCMATAQVQAQEEKATRVNNTHDKTMEEKHRSTQQDKMKHCNAQTKGMKGDEHKSKMRACLKD